ncbi:response regulator transcription factor [Agrococcus sp. Ld7]|uniref:response regulator transcription factor n=1 Tax=Agrococcus sp. Ld7 TaxID=649148 RepID=UPI0038662DB8
MMTPTEPGLRVLVVEDEEPLARLVETYLQRSRFAVQTTGDGAEALSIAREWDPDVVVLDLGLPGADGIEVCRALRTFSDCYVVMLTARAVELDKLVGLSAGADDYITKPFSPRELVARVKTMLRRPRGGARWAASSPLTFGALTLDPGGREVLVAGEPVRLTKTEFDVLMTLASRPQLACSRRQIIDAVWGPDWVGDEHLVDVHVAHVRRKLGDDPAAPDFICTVRGVGYRMGTGR